MIQRIKKDWLNIQESVNILDAYAWKSILTYIMKPETQSAKNATIVVIIVLEKDHSSVLAALIQLYITDNNQYLNLLNVYALMVFMMITKMFHASDAIHHV